MKYEIWLPTLTTYRNCKNWKKIPTFKKFWCLKVPILTSSLHFLYLFGKKKVDQDTLSNMTSPLELSSIAMV
jgi:hypothetical protein